MKDTIDVIEQIDVQCDRFEQAWKQKRTPKLAEYLAAFDPAVRIRAFPHLLTLELEYRQRLGERPRLDEYQQRFPDYALLIEEAFQFYTAPEQCREDSPVRREFTSSLLGALQDRYDVIRECGRGGMGVVYQARELATGRVVALKLLSFHPIWNEPDPDRLQRFEQEIRLAAQLEHDHIVRVYEVGRVEGHPYFSMQWIDGMNLSDYLELGPLDSYPAARLIQQLANTIHYAHQSGIIHRDLKPPNILLDRRHKPFVADFGLAKSFEGSQITQTHEVIGSPAYMSPEQVNCAVVDARSDVYSLGVTLYQCLTGQVPFEATSSLELLRQVTEDTPIAPSRLNPKIPRELEAICLKCLEKEAKQRYQTAAELSDDLGRFLSAKPVRAKPIGRITRSWRWIKRHPGRIGWMAILILLTSLSVASLLFWQQAESGRRAQAKLQVHAALQSAEILIEEAKLAPVRDPNRLIERREALQTLQLMLAESSSVAASQTELQQSIDILSAIHRDHQLLTDLEQSRLKAAGSLSLEPDQTTAISNGRLSYQFKLQPIVEYHHQVFVEHGIDPQVPIEAIVDSFETRPTYVQVAIISALNEAYVASFEDRSNPHAAQDFWGTLLDELDTDPWRHDYRAAIRANEYQQVLALAKRVNPSDSDSLLVLTWLGQELATNGYPDLGVDLLERLEAAHPGEFWVRYAFAGVYLHSANARPAEALRHATAAVAVRPVPIAYLLQGYGLLESIQPQRAKASFQKTLALEPNNLLARYGVASAFLRAGNLAASEKAFLEFTELSPQNPMGFYSLAQVQAKRSTYQAALETIDHAIALAPNWWLLHQQRGQILYHRFEYAPAIESFQTAKEYAPWHSEPDFMLGLCKIRIGDWEEGYASIQQIAEQKALNIEQCLLVGQACSRTQHHSKALTWLQRAYRLDPKHPQMLLSLGAEHCDHAFEFATALDYFHQLLSQEHPPKQVYQNLAVAYTRQGTPEMAARFSNEAIEAGLATPMMICLRAQNLRDAGMFQASLDTLQRYDKTQFPPKFQGRAEYLAEDTNRLLRAAEQLQADQLPDDFDSSLLAARACYYQQNYQQAAECLLEAEKFKPQELERTLGYELHLAIWVRAGASDAEMPARPRPYLPADFRERAYELMQRDLQNFDAFARQSSSRHRRIAWQTLRNWQERTEFAGIREANKLVLLPATERSRWQSLWQQVARLEQKFDFP